MTKRLDAAADAALDALGLAIAAKDIAAVGRVYAPDATVWHNYDDVTQSRDINLAALGRFFALFREIGYRNVRRAVRGRTAVQQHDLCGVAADGQTWSIPVCLVVTLDEDGRIATVAEYLDPSPLAALRQTLAAASPTSGTAAAAASR